jgi:hypothetical protein
MTFKQNDLKAMRSKSLLTEIENIYDEVSAFPDHVCFSTADKYSFLIHQKQEQAVEGNGDLTGPHMIFTYKVFELNSITQGVHPVKPSPRMVQ